MRKYVTNYKPISSQSARKWLSNWCGSTNEKSFPRLFFSCLGEERAVLCAAAVAWSASVCSFSVAQNSEPFSGSGFSQTGPCSSGPFRLSDSGAGVEGVDGMLMLGVGGLMGPLASWVRALAGGWACVWSWGESGSVCGVFGECCRCRSLSSCLASWSCGWGGTQTDKNRHEKTNGEQKDARTAWENVSTRDAQTHTKKKDQLGTCKQTHQHFTRLMMFASFPCGHSESTAEPPHFQMSGEQNTSQSAQNCFSYCVSIHQPRKHMEMHMNMPWKK